MSWYVWLTIGIAIGAIARGKRVKAALNRLLAHWTRGQRP